MSIPTYAEDNRFILKNRGLVIIVKHKLTTDPRLLLGKDVVIDGNKYTVKGVETYAVPYHRSDREENIGLLVEEGGLQQ